MAFMSPANRRYVARMFVSAALYVVTLFGVTWLYARGDMPDGPVRYLIAAIPVLPVAGTIWALMRFSSEEEDEYLRLLQNRAIVGAVGITLVVCVTWGLMQSYAGAGPVNLMHVYGVFWGALILTTIWSRVRALG